MSIANAVILLGVVYLTRGINFEVRVSARTRVMTFLC
jgi:hypothetical protein